jgi:hypothetical protein
VCSSDLACLTPWRGLPSKLDVSDAGADASTDGGDGDAGDDDAGAVDAAVDAGGDAGPDAGSDAGDGGGGIDPCSLPGVTCFDYTPSNFDPGTLGAALEQNGDLDITCADAVFDSTALQLSGSCSVPLQVVEITQPGGVDAVVIPVKSLTINGGTALHLVGNRPVIFAVFGDAEIGGRLDANAMRAAPGAGGNLACTTGTGANGTDQIATNPNNKGGGGGGGGAFGTNGASGGTGGWASATAAGGTPEGEPTLIPLRGGCAGGRGGFGSAAGSGNVGGPGGGALQVSTAGVLRVGGVIAAAGGGGQRGMLQQDGAGGGGSGGAVLLEGRSVNLSDAVWLTANGGGGGGGFDYDSTAPNASAGNDAPVDMATGGAGGARDSSGGVGGVGSGA